MIAQKTNSTDHIKKIQLDNDAGDKNHHKNPCLKVDSLVWTFYCKFYRNANCFYTHDLINKIFVTKIKQMLV